MQHPFNSRTSSFDANAINQTIQRALASAGLNTTSGPMHAVTETIRQALASGGPPTAAAAPATHDDVIDVAARVVRPGGTGIERSDDGLPRDRVDTPGTFETCQFSNAAGTTNPSTASSSFKVFAGDSAAGTPYWINADVCPNPGGGNFNIRDCVLLTAVPTRSDPAVGSLTLTSTGVKGCSVGTNMRLCWP